MEILWGNNFPKNFKVILLSRECLVDGNVKGNVLEEFFETRAKFVCSCYGNDGETFYYQNVVPEFRKMQRIPEGVDVNLWFEGDLFCQVNLWFVIHLLNNIFDNSMFFLIRPKKGSEYGFGGMDTSELMEAYQNRINILLELSQNFWCDFILSRKNSFYTSFPRVSGGNPVF